MNAGTLEMIRRLAVRHAGARPRDPLCDPDDLAQEAALALLRAAPESRDSPGLVATVARRAFADASMRSARLRSQEAAAAEAAAVRTRPALDDSEALDVREAVAALDDGAAEAVRRRYFDGEPAGRSGADKRRHAAALASLAASLGAAYADDFGRGVARRGLPRPHQWSGPRERPPQIRDQARDSATRRARKAAILDAAFRASARLASA